MIGLGTLLGSAAHSGKQVQGHDLMPGVARSRPEVRDDEDSDIAKTQQLLSERLSQRLAEKLPPANGAESASTAASSLTEKSTDDFSPAAVSERILGFIENRLKQEKANGASEEALRQRLGQGMEGVRQGLQEAREELESRGMFEGKVRDDYFETFGRLQQGLDDLEARFFDEAAAASGQGGVTQVVATGTTRAAQGPVVSASREFAMEVTTQDGDVVRINVSSAREFSSMAASLETENVEGGEFGANYSGEDAFSFEVEGELDKGEMNALKELFAQVNKVAETFYGGDVEAAFEQALSVGYDQNELAGFAANMTQTQTVAVTQAYAGVAQAGGGDFYGGGFGGNGNQNGILDALVDFSKQIRDADHELKSNLESLHNGSDLFRQLVGQLPFTAAAPSTEEENTIANASPWQEFVDGVLAPAES